MSSPDHQDYNRSIPNGNDDLATSQGNFLDNFFQLYEAFGRNHVDLDAGALAGNHTVIELVQRPQGIETSFGEISMYAKDVEGQTDQIFIRYQGDGTEVQLTNYQIYKPAQPPGQELFIATLPGKLLVNFGTVTPVNTQNGNTLVLWPNLMKNIMGVNFCPKGTVSSRPPTIKVQKNTPGIYSGLRLFDITPANISYFYIVIGNI